MTEKLNLVCSSETRKCIDKLVADLYGDLRQVVAEAFHLYHSAVEQARQGNVPAYLSPDGHAEPVKLNPDVLLAKYIERHRAADSSQ